MHTRTFAALAAVPMLAAAVLAGCWGGPPGTRATSGGTSGSATSPVATTTPEGGSVPLGGQDGRLPKEFPADLPLYTKSVRAGSVVATPEGRRYSVQMVSGDAVSAVYARYRDQLNQAGFTIGSTGDITVAGRERAFMTFQKGKATGAVTITQDRPGAGGRTTIDLQVIVPK